MSEKLPSSEANESAERKAKLIELLREQGPENNETRKAFFIWKIIRDHEVHVPEDQEKDSIFLNARIQIIEAISQEEMFEGMREKYLIWETSRKEIKKDVKRISNRKAEIDLLIEEADIYKIAGWLPEALEALEVAKIEAYQEAAAAHVTDPAANEKFANLFDEIQAKIEKLS